MNAAAEEGSADEPSMVDVVLGERIQKFRAFRRQSLRQVATRADVSPSFLSQLERGRCSASIASLARIAGALDVSLADLFDTSHVGSKPLRYHERAVLKTEGGTRKTLLTREAIPAFGYYGVEFEPGGSTGTEQYSHPGCYEVVVGVLNQVNVELGGTVHTLGAGDSLEYWSDEPHRIFNDSGDTAIVYWLVAKRAADR